MTNDTSDRKGGEEVPKIMPMVPQAGRAPRRPSPAALTASSPLACSPLAARVSFPVRVVAGAFGEGRPRRDLLLSPDHAVFVDHVLIPAKHLI